MSEHMRLMLAAFPLAAATHFDCKGAYVFSTQGLQTLPGVLHNSCGFDGEVPYHQI
jgi:hypothetical protein